jgi:acid phosphatase
VRKHEPFISFLNVQKDPKRCAKIVNSNQLPADVAAGQLSQYSLYIPDLKNDAHDTGVAYASKWLEGFLTPLLANPSFTRNTLVVVTFDEDQGGTATNQIYTVLLGDPVKPGVVNNTLYNHYSLLRTIEDNFKLGNLGREDSKASVITGIWKGSNS